jgi:sulfatase maturation enzyme AslB (radical SAM superfamily)
MEMSNEKATNVIYLTTRCNLNCEYCYEKKDRDRLNNHFDSTEEDVAKFIDNLVDIEKDNISIVLFGGEPFLRWDLIKFALKYKQDKYPNLNIWFSTATNGIKFKSKTFLKEVKKYLEKYPFLTIEVSYDGSGTYRRVDNKGKDRTKDIEKALRNFEELNVPYRIRYTIHAGNYKTINRDLVEIILKYPHVERIVTSINYSEMDKILNIYDTEEIQNYFKPFAQGLFVKFKKPICGLTCELCQICDKYDNNRYYINNEIIEEKKHLPFNHFSKTVK